MNWSLRQMLGVFVCVAIVLAWRQQGTGIRCFDFGAEAADLPFQREVNSAVLYDEEGHRAAVECWARFLVRKNPHLPMMKDRAHDDAEERFARVYDKSKERIIVVVHSRSSFLPPPGENGFAIPDKNDWTSRLSGWVWFLRIPSVDDNAPDLGTTMSVIIIPKGCWFAASSRSLALRSDVVLILVLTGLCFHRQIVFVVKYAWRTDSQQTSGPV